MLFASNPELLPFGLLGIFGEEAKKSADEVLTIYGFVLLITVVIGIIGLVIYLVGSALGAF